jgi:hypothetical protein
MITNSRVRGAAAAVLSRPGSVVEDDQHPPTGQGRAEQPRSVVDSGRDGAGKYIKIAQNPPSTFPA